MIRFQHTPVVDEVDPQDCLHLNHSHDLIMEFIEQCPLESLGEVVGHHLLGGTVLDRDFVARDPVGDEEIPDVNVAGALPAR